LASSMVTLVLYQPVMSPANFPRY